MCFFYNLTMLNHTLEKSIGGINSSNYIYFGTISWIELFALTFLIFLLGLSGIVFNHKNFLLTLFSIEIMYLGITLSFIILSITTGDPKGQIYAIILLIIAAAESAIGLGMLIVLYKFGRSIDFENYQELKG